MSWSFRRIWAWPTELRRRGILGINARNADYVLPLNRREFYPRVDNKLLTKRIAEEHGIPVPKTFAVVEKHGDVRRFPELLGGRDDFVIKPGAGSEGRGIIVISSYADEAFVTPGGERWEVPELRYHLSTVLSGLYSLGGQPDCALIEQRMIRHPVFASIAVGGTPDIRVILYRSTPVMAMVRLPTMLSRGRANLHQGAVAAGIDLVTGRTFGGVCKNRTVMLHPDTQQPIAGVAVPDWDRLLDAAMRLSDVIGLGYLGVDFVLDVNLGPVILEANARPGLAIQVANRRGIWPRLAYLDALPVDRLAPECRRDLIAQLAAID